METRKKRTKVVVSVSALACLVVFSLSGYAGKLEPSGPPGPTMKTLDEVEPRIPISQADIPLTISTSGSYYLTEDIIAAGTAVTIDVDNVTIDLMGYSLTGPGKESGTNYGIYMSGRSNVEIRNGTIRNFGYHGIYEASSTGRQHRIISVRVISNGFYGILLDSQCNLIKDCVAKDNAGTGIDAGYYSTVTGCLACYNTYDGIKAGSSSVMIGNNASNNGLDGIDAQSGSTVINNTAISNDASGIFAWTQCVLIGNSASSNLFHGIDAWYSCTIINNCASGNGSSGIDADMGSTVIGNSVRNNTGDGILIRHDCVAKDNNCKNNGYGTGDGAGICARGNDARIESNNVVDNDRGIDVKYAGNIIIKNTASGNGTNYDIVAGNAVGDILDFTSGGTITSNNPWANFEF